MKPIFRTISFWACVGMAPINMAIFFIADQLHDRNLQALSLLTLAACAIGAGSHWYLDRLLSKRR